MSQQQKDALFGVQQQPQRVPFQIENDDDDQQQNDALEEELQRHIIMQRSEMQKQDQLLDLMSQGITRLKGTAQNMGDELNKQNKGLKKLQYEVDKADIVRYFFYLQNIFLTNAA